MVKEMLFEEKIWIVGCQGAPLQQDPPSELPNVISTRG